MGIRQAGFTTIELAMVTVIIAILAATALPRLTAHLQHKAARAGVQAVAGAISSASAINEAALQARSSERVVTAGRTCHAAAADLLPAGVPAGYTVTSSMRLNSANNMPTPCRVIHMRSGARDTAMIVSVN